MSHFGVEFAFSLALPQFRAELRAYIHRAIRDKSDTFGHPSPMMVRGEMMNCRVVVRPSSLGIDGSENALVSFETTPLNNRATANAASVANLEDHEDRIAELEQELKATRENLQTVVEELETSNEELQSLNEEMQASNEELQASNEELETANEELQASNEELSTVNDQLGLKTREVAEVVTDLTNIQDSIGRALLVVSDRLQVLRSNASARQLFPQLIEEPNIHLQSLTGSNTLPNELTKMIHRVVIEEQDETFNYEHKGRHYQVDLYPYQHTDQDTDRVVLAIEDISEFAKIHIELERSAKDLRELIETSSAPIIGVDPKGRINEWNQTAARLLDLSKDDASGRLLADLCKDEKSRVRITEIIDQALREETTESVEFPLRNSSGKLVEILFSSKARRSQGEVVGVLCIGQDVTERNQAVAQLVHASKMAHLGQMTTGMAHELNQPLQIMKGATDNLVRRIKSGKADAAYTLDKVERVQHQIQRAAKIIDHMRVFGRKAGTTLEEVDVTEAVTEVVDMLSDQLRLNHIDLQLDLAESVPGTHAHKVLLEQVVLNLTSNAIDAILSQSDHKRELRISSEYVPNDGIKLVIEDTGGGIPEQDLDQIFEPFYTTKEVGEGTGLGLSITYGIVDDMGGTITAENTEEGARMVVTLPAVEPEAEAQEPAAAETSDHN